VVAAAEASSGKGLSKREDVSVEVGHVYPVPQRQRCHLDAPPAHSGIHLMKYAPFLVVIGGLVAQNTLCTTFHKPSIKELGIERTVLNYGRLLASSHRRVVPVDDDPSREHGRQPLLLHQVQLPPPGGNCRFVEEGEYDACARACGIGGQNIIEHSLLDPTLEQGIVDDRS